MKKKIGELFFQIIPVMIGVYLGFLASNWASNSQKKHESKILIENLLSEIDTNETTLKDVIEYHKMLLDSSRYYSRDRNKIENTKYFKGTRLLKLSSSAYNTGIQTGVINEMSIDDIQNINQLYTFQDDYNEFGKMMMTSLISKDFSDKEEDKKKIARLLALTMSDIVIKEKQLISWYADVKEKLKK